MQYFSLLLTLLLLGWFFYVVTGCRRLDERRTGAVVLRVAGVSRWPRLMAMASQAAVVAVMAPALIVMVNISHDLDGWLPTLSLFNLSACLAMMTYQFVVLLRTQSAGSEIRQRGLVLRGWRGWPGEFFPWKDVKYCKWKDRATLFVQCRLGNFVWHVRPALVEQVTSALRGKVEVRGPDGAVISPQPPSAIDGLECDARSTVRPQFRLVSLLLLAAVVAAASGFVAIHYQRQRQCEAIRAELERFQGHVVFEGTDVVELYAAWDAPISDDDLAVLESHRKLRHLELRNANVTDAGLRHLESLPGLMYIDIQGTGTTQEGLDRLRRALPRAVIEANNFPPQPAASGPSSGR